MKIPGKIFSVSIVSGYISADRLLSSVGALLAICLTGAFCALLFGAGVRLPLIVAPIGASAVLVFAVPASPLAQPWPVIGGNMISAFVGVAVAHMIAEPVIATGVAVGFAIFAMSLTRSLHPPGGAAALTAVIGGAVVKDFGFLFPFVPVAVNSMILVSLGMLFHRFSQHNYPHRAAQVLPNQHKTADTPPALRAGFNSLDIDRAIGDMHEDFDIDRGDLDELLRRVEERALQRTRGDVRCQDIMSRDVIKLTPSSTPDDARELLLKHHFRILPLVDTQGELLGIISFKELDGIRNQLPFKPAAAVTAAPGDAAVSLLPKLTDGRTHDVVVIDAKRHVMGIVSQTDLLVALSKNLLWNSKQG